MDEPKAVVPVGAVRERVIQTLTEAFANDIISVAELEDRLERVYRATSAAEAEALIVGLRPAPGASVTARGGPPPPVIGHDRDRERFSSIFSSQSRRGVWTVPREMDITCIFSDTTLDFSQATLPRDIIDIHVSVVFASIKIVVPAGLRVVNRIGAFAASVESEPALDLAPMVPGAPVIRLTGNATFASVEIVASNKLPRE